MITPIKYRHEDFNTFLNFAAHVDTTNNPQMQFLSRYADKAANDPSIENYDLLNQFLTNRYYAENNAGHKLMWDPSRSYAMQDRTTELSDRYFYSGCVENTGGADGSIFKSTNIDGINTDGYAFIPTPFVNFTPGGFRWTRDYGNLQNSIRLRLRFDDLPANTFVPLFGYTYQHTQEPQAAAGGYYRPYHRYFWVNTNKPYSNGAKTTTFWGYPLGMTRPQGASSNSTNLYGSASKTSSYLQNDFMRNTMIWFLYAHDGNGNGMIATCAGDADQSSPHAYRPTNSHYGSNNGYFDFVAPTKLTAPLAAGETLQDLWNSYGDGGSRVSTTHPVDWRSIYQYWVTDHWGRLRNTGNKTYADRYSHGSYNLINWAHPYGNSPYVISYDNSYGQYPGPFSFNQMQLVAFGPVNNSTFSTAQDIHVNVNTLTKANGRLSRYHITNTATSSNNVAACQLRYSGDILGLKFRDVPGQMYYDRTGSRYHYCYWNGWTCLSRTENFGDSRLGNISTALVLRPTHTGGGEVHDMSMVTYTNAGGYHMSEPSSTRKYHRNYSYVSADSTLYEFPTDKHDTYDVVSEARANDGADVTGGWSGANKLFDMDYETVCTDIVGGEQNAMYIPFNDCATVTGTSDGYVLNRLGITIRGVGMNWPQAHRLKLAVVDSTKNTTLLSTGTQDKTLGAHVTENRRADVYEKYYDFGGIIKQSDSSVFTYDELRQGYLKVWADPVPIPITKLTSPTGGTTVGGSNNYLPSGGTGGTNRNSFINTASHGLGFLHPTTSEKNLMFDTDMDTHSGDYFARSGSVVWERLTIDTDAQVGTIKIKFGLRDILTQGTTRGTPNLGIYWKTSTQSWGATLHAFMNGYSYTDGLFQRTYYHRAQDNNYDDNIEQEVTFGFSEGIHQVIVMAHNPTAISDNTSKGFRIYNFDVIL